MSTLNNTQDAPSAPNLRTLPNETGLSVCGDDSGDYYTVIYTRGQLDRGGVFGQGQIESIPFRHKCIYKTPVVDGKIDVLNMSWKYLNPDLVELMRAVWSRHNNGNLDLGAFRREAGNLLVLAGNIMDDIPFAIDAYGGIEGPNRNAYVKKLHADDDRLACQRRRHAMILASPWALDDEQLLEEIKEHEYLISQVSHNIDADMHIAFHNVLFHRRDADRLALLQLDWSLMTGLESLCLDLSGPWIDGPNAALKSFCVELGSHLKLKTLVVLGLPVRQEYCKLGKDFWAKTLENQEYVPSTVVKSHSEDSDESNESNESDGSDDDPDEELVGFPTYIYWLKDCLQPGGQIHFVMQYESETEP
ncbi:uncharacterized protein FMAN_01204 [Fusarium mangiferae]|uniref:Uncharacterized protein n=1 Tax=Fusarium mangiferae TaxID=192010 RepID=A0A1L7SHU7_FUSMA|nr:uncharacterized protein FMAN_01204 [Fusarium mangiferae]CVK83973.1 uncharacterized protein FMAN_01204 [Fusarium mangiferae]